MKNIFAKVLAFLVLACTGVFLAGGFLPISFKLIGGIPQAITSMELWFLTGIVPFIISVLIGKRHNAAMNKKP